jgi:hypothetical protein
VIPPSDLAEESPTRKIPIYSRKIDEEEEEYLMYDEN